MTEEINTKSPLRIEISDNLRSTLAGELNRLHDRSFSDRFWGIILESYVKTAITRKKLLEEKNPNFNVPVLPLNSYHFPGKKEILKEQLKEFVKHIQTRADKNKIYRLLKEKDLIRIGFHEFPGIEEYNDEIGHEFPLYHLHFFRKSNNKLRKRLVKIGESKNDVFTKNLILHLPKFYVEYFEGIYDSIPLFNPADKQFHIHNMRTSFDEMLVAKYVEEGAKLIWYQHGSHYGEYKWEYLHHYEHLMADEYRTWGWQIYEKDNPWKAYRLEAFHRTYRKFDNSGEYNLMLCYPKMYHKYRNHCVETTKFLEQNLDFKKFPEILGRPRPMHKKHSHEKELSFISCENIDIGGGLEPIERQVSRSKVVVQISVPSTNFLECIYVDHPVTGILNNTDPTEVIKPFYSYFLEKGVLHEDVQSLVRFLNTTDLETWWSEITGSEIYNQFKQNFTGNVALGKKG